MVRFVALIGPAGDKDDEQWRALTQRAARQFENWHRAALGKEVVVYADAPAGRVTTKPFGAGEGMLVGQVFGAPRSLTDAALGGLPAAGALGLLLAPCW